MLWVIMCVDHCSQRLALSSHQCAAKILGVGDPKAAYDRFNFNTWKNKLDIELRASGLPGAIQELTREMVDRARIKALLSETDTMTKYLRELRSVQGCVPLSNSPSSFHVILADESFWRQGGPRMITIPPKSVTIELVNNSRIYWTPGRARSMFRSRTTASCSNGHSH